MSLDATTWTDWLEALEVDVTARRSDLEAGRSVARAEETMGSMMRPSSPVPSSLQHRATDVLLAIRSLEDALLEAAATVAAASRAHSAQRSALTAHRAANGRASVPAVIDHHV